jgi:hypothetical protein
VRGESYTSCAFVDYHDLPTHTTHPCTHFSHPLCLVLFCSICSISISVDISPPSQTAAHETFRKPIPVTPQSPHHHYIHAPMQEMTYAVHTSPLHHLHNRRTDSTVQCMLPSGSHTFNSSLSSLIRQHHQPLAPAARTLNMRVHITVHDTMNCVTDSHIQGPCRWRARPAL